MAAVSPATTNGTCSTATIHRWLPDSVYTSSSKSRTPTPSFAPTDRTSMQRKDTRDCLLAEELSREMHQPFDLASSDGMIMEKTRVNRSTLTATVVMDKVSPMFRGFDTVEESSLHFALKSSLTQTGLNSTLLGSGVSINRSARTITVSVSIEAITPLGVLTLDYLEVGSYVGKVFAADPRRLVRAKMYLERLFDVRDARGAKVLSYEGKHGFEDLRLHNGRIVVFLPVQPGVVRYDSDIHTLLPTIGRALLKKSPYKHLLRLHQTMAPGHTRVCAPGDMLMVRSTALSMSTMFGKVVDELLPAGLKCASSCIIESDRIVRAPEDAAELTEGRTFVFVGHSTEELTHIPIEFFTNECFREYVPLAARKTLPQRIEDPAQLVAAFKTMPELHSDTERARPDPCCTYVCKGGMLDNINIHDWISATPKKDDDYQATTDAIKRLTMAQDYQRQQAEFPILTALSNGSITSDGILLSRYFPSPVIKSLLLSRDVARHLKHVYFTIGSRKHGEFLSQKDQNMLVDLASFGIRCFYVDMKAVEVFEYIRRPRVGTGMFVPLNQREHFNSATFFGVYGSNLVEGDFESELEKLMQGVMKLRKTSTHPLINPNKPIALVTGGGPGAMEVGNRVAKRNGLISCGLFVDFGSLAAKPGANINEQKKNPFVEAFMTYRPDKLVERQSDFNLHFPIFLTGGVGTDFEYALEEVRRKVGTIDITPLIIFGSAKYMAGKVGGRFKENFEAGTIKGSEWLSNVPYVVNTGREALSVIEKFANGTLPIGSKHPTNSEGFMVIDPATLEPKVPEASH